MMAPARGNAVLFLCIVAKGRSRMALLPASRWQGLGRRDSFCLGIGHLGLRE
jgi:hypothetical protein